MGRLRTYATSSAKKRARREREKQIPRTRVYLGEIMDLWKEIKETVGAFAKILLDRLVIYNLSASVIFILSRISKRITSGICYAENPRRFYVFFAMQCRCDGWGNPCMHGGMGIGLGCGMCARPLVLVPPRNALCYHSTSSLFSLKIITDISHHYTNFILIYEHTDINNVSLKMHVRHYYY